ncbi:hypothetical protein [Amycolatopsis minnesotensis]|uniref:Excreted virulence factor EspC (Type VII ESX diderm) n=1 Tax=Amycolatopsis minnesotensis TaxID=337894 RepID=A0ABN2RDE7_9PSEU
MSGGYRVGLAEMGSLITTLGQAKERMTSANKALGDSSPVDMGSREIDTAGSDFQDRWEYGIGKIAEFSGSMVEALNAAKKLYQEMDDNVADMLRKSGGDGAAPAPVPEPGKRSAIADRLDGLA